MVAAVLKVIASAPPVWVNVPIWTLLKVTAPLDSVSVPSPVNTSVALAPPVRCTVSTVPR